MPASAKSARCRRGPGPDARVSQVGADVVQDPGSVVRVSQVGADVVWAYGPTNARTRSQLVWRGAALGILGYDIVIDNLGEWVVGNANIVVDNAAEDVVDNLGDIVEDGGDVVITNTYWH